MGSKDGYILSGKAMIICTGHIRITELGIEWLGNRYPMNCIPLQHALYPTVDMHAKDSPLDSRIAEGFVVTTISPE